MFNPFRSLLILQLECTLQFLNLSKQFLEMYLSAQPQPSKVTSSMLALVPVKANDTQDAPRPVVRAIGRR